MTDKEIENLLNKIHKSNNGNGYFLDLRIDLKKEAKKNAVILNEFVNISYLENDLKLVIRYFYIENAQANIIRLSSKGLKVIEKGGWIKYKKWENNKKRWNNIKKDVLYCFNIIIPLAGLYIAYLAVKSDNRSMKEDILNELKTQQKELNKKHQERLEIVTKKVDSLYYETNGQPK